MHLGGLLAQQFRDFVARGAEFPVMRGIAVAQDVRRHLLREASCFGEREDGGEELADVRGRPAAPRTVVGAMVVAGEEPARLGVLRLQRQQHSLHRFNQRNVPIFLIFGVTTRFHPNCNGFSSSISTLRSPRRPD